jgi:hypothetical protein
MEKDLASDSFIENWPHWLRWILFIPAAVIGAMLVSILWGLFALMGSEGFERSLWTEEAQNFILGAAFVFIGAATAPKNQFVVGLILLIVAVIIGTLTSTLSFMNETDRSFGLVLLDCIVLVAGGAIVLYYIHEEV